MCLVLLPSTFWVSDLPIKLLNLHSKWSSSLGHNSVSKPCFSVRVPPLCVAAIYEDVFTFLACCTTEIYHIWTRVHSAREYRNSGCALPTTVRSRRGRKVHRSQVASSDCFTVQFTLRHELGQITMQPEEWNVALSIITTCLKLLINSLTWASWLTQYPLKPWHSETMSLAAAITMAGATQYPTKLTEWPWWRSYFCPKTDKHTVVFLTLRVSYFTAVLGP